MHQSRHGRHRHAQHGLSVGRTQCSAQAEYGGCVGGSTVRPFNASVGAGEAVDEHGRDGTETVY